MSGDPKTREEYLIAYHDKLLAERKDTTDLINNHLIFTYVLIGLVIAIKSQLIVKLSAGGPEFDLHKPIILDYVVILVFLTYVLVAYHLRKLARILREIRKNSLELVATNPQSRPVDIRDIGLFMSGVAGLIFAMARAEVRIFLIRILRLSGMHLVVEAADLVRSTKDQSITKSQATKLSFTLARHAAMWMVEFFTLLFIPFLIFGYRFLLGFAILFAPLICTVGYAIADRMRIPDYVGGKLPAYFLSVFETLSSFHIALWVVFLVVFIGTLFATFALLARYSKDLIDDFLDELDASLGNIEAAATTLAQVVGVSLPVDIDQAALRLNEFRRTMERVRAAVRKW